MVNKYTMKSYPLAFATYSFLGGYSALSTHFSVEYFFFYIIFS